MAWITILSLQRATDTWCCLSRNFLDINTPSAVDMHHQSGGAYLTDRTVRDHSYDWILYSTLLYACVAGTNAHLIHEDSADYHVRV